MLRQLYEYAFATTPTSKTQNLLATLAIDSNRSLPTDYLDMVEEGWKGEEGIEMFQEWIAAIKTSNTPSALVKMLTVVVKVVRSKEYAPEWV